MLKETEQSKNFNDYLTNLNICIENYHKEAIEQINKLDIKGKQWFTLEEKLTQLKEKLDTSQTILTFNVGGEYFYTSLSTILKENDNIFYNLILTERLDYTKEIFIDRCPFSFKAILKYLRNKEINLNIEEHSFVKKLLEEASYYEITKLEDLIKVHLSQVRLVSFEFAGPYRSGDVVIGTNSLKDIQNHDDKSGTKGFCICTNGWIIFKLDRVTTLSSLDVMGYRGNTKFSANNGANAKILVSTDKKNWAEVGIIPTSFSSNIANVPFKNKPKAAYIKIQATGYLGISYFKLYS
jgi:hypothetical protein